MKKVLTKEIKSITIDNVSKREILEEPGFRLKNEEQNGSGNAPET